MSHPQTDAQGGFERDVPEPSKENEAETNDVKITVVSATPVPNPPDCNFHTIVLDCSSWGFIDTMGVKVLISVSSNDMNHLMEKPTMWFPIRSDTNRQVQAQKRARSLKFRI